MKSVRPGDWYTTRNVSLSEKTCQCDTGHNLPLGPPSSWLGSQLAQIVLFTAAFTHRTASLRRQDRHRWVVTPGRFAPQKGHAVACKRTIPRLFRQLAVYGDVVLTECRACNRRARRSRRERPPWRAIPRRDTAPTHDLRRHRAVRVLCLPKCSPIGGFPRSCGPGR
jgi:hypothetical protein